MMVLSTRSLPLFGILLITVFGVSCAQPGAGNSALPTSPSALSAGAAATALGPGASYDASGLWRFVVTDIHGNDQESFDANVSQDANGDLSFLDEDGGLITLKRLGTGVIITYRQSTIGNEGGECDVLIQGTARLDTRTHTIAANIILRELGCSRQHLRLIARGTRLS